MRNFTIKGHSRQIDIVISELNEVPIDAHDLSLKRDVFFNPVFVGSEDSQTISVANSSGIPIEYEWVWVPADSKDRELSYLGREAIARRIEHDEAQRNRGPATEQEINMANWAVDQITGHGSGSSIGDNHDTSAGGLVIDVSGNISDTMDMSKAAVTTSASHGPFALHPCRGVLAADGFQTFTLDCVPTAVTSTSAKVCLLYCCIYTAVISIYSTIYKAFVVLVVVDIYLFIHD